VNSPCDRGKPFVPNGSKEIDLQIDAREALSFGVKVLNSGHGRTTCGFLFSNGKKFIHPSLVWLAKR
jgi:hypothetical protein